MDFPTFGWRDDSPDNMPRQNQKGVAAQMSNGYTKQFKQQAMSLVTEHGRSPSQAARELGMPDSTLAQWLKKSGWRKPEEQGPLPEDSTALKVRVRELERQVKRLETEKDIVKKATAYFASLNSSVSTSSTSDEGSIR
jgi:transposase